jgi:hypothetical protein
MIQQWPLSHWLAIRSEHPLGRSRSVLLSSSLVPAALLGHGNSRAIIFFLVCRMGWAACRWRIWGSPKWWPRGTSDNGGSRRPAVATHVFVYSGCCSTSRMSLATTSRCCRYHQCRKTTATSSHCCRQDHCRLPPSLWLAAPGAAAGHMVRHPWHRCCCCQRLHCCRFCSWFATPCTWRRLTYTQISHVLLN